MDSKQHKIMPKLFRTSRRWAVLVPLMLLTAGAIPQAASAATKKEATIKIGVISTDTFSGVSIKDTPVTAQDWQAYINAHGGVNGHPVSVIEKNDQGNPATTLQDFKELKASGVVAIGDASIVDSAFEKQADAAHIPVIGLTSSLSSTPFTTDPNFFPNGTTEMGGIWGLLKAAALTGNTKFGAMYCAEAAACGQVVPALSAVGATVGVKVDYTAAILSSSPDYTSQCLAAQSAGVNALWVAAASTVASQRVIDNCAAQGYYPTIDFYGSPITAAEKADTNIKSAVSTSQVIPYFVVTKHTAAFRAGMGKYLPKAVSPFSVMIDWVGLQEIAVAAKVGVKAGAKPSAADIYRGLYSFKANTVGGLTTPLTFVKGKPHPDNCAFFFALRNGRFVTPYGTSSLCEK